MREQGCRVLMLLLEPLGFGIRKQNDLPHEKACDWQWMCLETQPGAHLIPVFWSAGRIAGCLDPSSNIKGIAEIAENKLQSAFNATLSYFCDMVFAVFSAEQTHTVSVRLWRVNFEVIYFKKIPCSMHIININIDQDFISFPMQKSQKLLCCPSNLLWQL